MKATKVIKITTPRQFEKMVELLEKKPELAQSYHNSLHKVDTKEEWKDIAIKLNSLGPPFRSGPEWTKVWADYKCNLKKKLLHNKCEGRATGGGCNKQYILTPVEEAASALLQLNSIICPDGVEIGITNNAPSIYAVCDLENEEIVCATSPLNNFKSKNFAKCVSNRTEPAYTSYDLDIIESEEIVPLSALQNKFTSKKAPKKVLGKTDPVHVSCNFDIKESDEVVPTSSSQKKFTPKKIARNVTDKTELIEQQLKVQTDLYNEVKESLKQIERYSRKQLKVQEETLNLYKSNLKRKKEKFDFYKKQCEKKDEHRRLLLQLRVDEIDLKKRRIEIEEYKQGLKM